MRHVRWPMTVLSPWVFLACVGAGDETPDTGRTLTHMPDLDAGASAERDPVSPDDAAPGVTEPEPSPDEGSGATGGLPPPPAPTSTSAPDPTPGADAGSSEPPPDPVPPPEPPPPLPPRDPAAAACWLVYLGDWNRCEELTESESAKQFSTASECAEDCLADPDCTGLIDWTWIGVSTCRTYHASGCTPVQVDYGEEDAGRAYGVECGDTPPDHAIATLSDLPGLVSDPTSGCRYVFIGDGLACEGDVSWAAAEATGNSLVECLAACEADPDCSAVKDAWWGGPETFECALHLGSCDAPGAGSYETRFFRKECPP